MIQRINAPGALSTFNGMNRISQPSQYSRFKAWDFGFTEFMDSDLLI